MTPDKASWSWRHGMYRLLAWGLLIPTLCWLWARGRREPAYRQGLGERLGWIDPGPSVRGGLWIHAASVGEAQAALTLWPALEAQWGKGSLLWTTQTPAGRRLLQERLPPGAQVFYAPIDAPGPVARFLQQARPRTLLLLERELWPEWLWQCEQRAIEVAVVNARLKASSAERWPYRTRWFKQRLQALHRVLCADAASARRFADLGLDPARIAVLGNLKFDQAPPSATPQGLSEALAGRTVLVAASTHAEDEEALLAGWGRFWASWPRPAERPLLVLAPRHPQRFAQVGQWLQQTHGLEASRELAIRSQGQVPGPDTQVWLLDTIGELREVYSGAQLCLMGGTWADVGGHNALEALAVGCPVLCGPHTHQFPELYEDMVAAGAACRASADELWPQATALLTEAGRQNAGRRAALAFVAAQRGSAQRTLAALATLNTWPRTPMPAVAVQGHGADTWWVCPGAMPQGDPHLFDHPWPPTEALSSASALATGSGRGPAQRLQVGQVCWVWRHYRRGGLMARWTQDTYPAQSSAHSRAMQEFALLRALGSEGLPVAAPVAARCERIWPGWGRWSRYRADIVLQYLPHTHNLVQCLRQQALAPSAWAALGQAIAALHRHQVFHADLNAHNLLLDAQGQAFVVDFDKCERRPGHAWKNHNLQRLQRSLRKERHRHPALHWDEATDWPALLCGYTGKA
jgi:3-deoxy-D-manno-octulosonic-acid transferase